MGIAFTIPSYTVSVPGGGESPVQPKEFWFIPDNGSVFTYGANFSVVCNITLHDGNETLGHDSATVTFSGVNGLHGTSTNENNGTNAHDVRISPSATGTATISSSNNPSSGTGVPYARVNAWDGSALHLRGVSDMGGRLWPRGIYGWNGSALGGIQH